MSNLKRLEQLKSMLSQEKKLDTVWSFFMDHFADHEEFTDLGEATRHPLVEKVVGTIIKQLFAQRVEELLLIGLPDYQFVHGVFSVGGRTGGVIYFEETQTGMVAVSESPLSKQVKYSRFTGKPMRASRQAELN